MELWRVMELWREAYLIVDGMITGPVRHERLSVWAAVHTETGEVDATDVQGFDDDLAELSDGWEWREFILVPVLDGGGK